MGFNAFRGSRLAQSDEVLLREFVGGLGSRHISDLVSDVFDILDFGCCKGGRAWTVLLFLLLPLLGVRVRGVRSVTLR